MLVADAHAPTRADVRRALVTDGGFVVCAEAANAAEAVQGAVREQPDLCLLDVRMPGSGLAAAWEIGARLPKARVVMLATSDDDRDLFAALHAGVAGYLVKTTDLERLPQALRGAANGEVAMRRALVARVLETFASSEPRRRELVGEAGFPERLTSREWEVLGLLAQERSSTEIARRLSLSNVTVRVHISAIIRKLGVEDRAAAVELFRGRAAV